MSTAVVLFTRDLRVRDHPALEAAVREHRRVVPLFVLDPRLLTSANRVAFLLQALDDLRSSLDGALVVRRGDPAAACAALRPDVVHVTADWSPYARERIRRLRGVAEVRAFPGVAVVEPGEVSPAGRDHYRVFTPYWRAWRSAPLRQIVARPPRAQLPRGLEPGSLPGGRSLVRGEPSPKLPRGGETAGRVRLRRFLQQALRSAASETVEPGHDASSRLSPYLRFGCVSPLELASAATELAGGEELLRRLCWRDFCLQLLAAFPRLESEDLRPRGREWRTDGEALEAWRVGRTGIPIVDAGMRQLQREGWMPNRVRMLAAAQLTKDLGVDWRLGAAHFFRLLVDGDPASNAANWQWVAGTGTDPRPNRRFNPVRQALRFDPDGAYVRRHLPELAELPGASVHEPWTLGARALAELGYPAPLVEPGCGRGGRVASAAPRR